MSQPTPSSPRTDELNLIRVLLGVVMSVSFVTNLYFLSQTAGQPVWWDEANYLVKAKSLALGTPATGYDNGRPILFSIMMAPFFALGLGELGIRACISLLSVLSVYLVYRVGKQILSPWVGLIGASLFSCHYLTLFYANRIMCEIPYVAFALLGLLLFLSGQRKLIWASGPMFAVSVMLRYPAFMIPVSLLVYVLATERTRALRRVDYWICLGLASLTVAPDILLRLRGALRAQSWMVGSVTSENRLENFSTTVKMFLSFWDPVSQVTLLVALLLAVWQVMSWRRCPPEIRNASLLLWSLVMGQLLLQGLYIIHLEDRYLYGTLAPATLLVASVFWQLVQRVPWPWKKLVMLPVVACVLWMCGAMLLQSQRVVAAKLASYEELRIAGRWLAKHKVNDDALVLSRSIAQLTYYSDLPGAKLPDSEEEFQTMMASGQAQYAVVSGLEAHPEWAKRLNLTALGLEVVKAYPRKQPRIGILQRTTKAPSE